MRKWMIIAPAFFLSISFLKGQVYDSDSIDCTGDEDEKMNILKHEKGDHKCNCPEDYWSLEKYSDSVNKKIMCCYIACEEILAQAVLNKASAKLLVNTYKFSESAANEIMDARDILRFEVLAAEYMSYPNWGSLEGDTLILSDSIPTIKVRQLLAYLYAVPTLEDYEKKLSPATFYVVDSTMHNLNAEQREQAAVFIYPAATTNDD